jgi:hypothetical protein
VFEVRGSILRVSDGSVSFTVIIFYLNIHRTLLTQYCAGDKIEKNELGGGCSADREGDRRV